MIECARRPQVLFEGKPVGTPDANAYWRVVEEHKVNAMFTAPTALRAIRKADPTSTGSKLHDISSLRTLFVAGERADPDTVEHFHRSLGVPVVDNWWQTETGWPIAGIQAEEVGNKPGSTSLPIPGYNVRVFDADTKEELPRGELGSLAIRLPLPPGTMQTLYNNDERCRTAAHHSNLVCGCGHVTPNPASTRGSHLMRTSPPAGTSYFEEFPGYYSAGDAGLVDSDGYIHVMGRTDDVINCAGHRLSTGALEEVVAAHGDVAECAVIGAADELKGQVPVGLVVLTSGCDKTSEQVADELVAKVRAEIGAVASFRHAAVVSALPKTRSGKTLRGLIQSIADGKSYKVPGTIEDEAPIAAVTTALQGLGYPKAKAA